MYSDKPYVESSFTPTRPPQRNPRYSYSNSPEYHPRTILTDGMDGYLLACHNIDLRQDDGSVRTDSTVTVIPEDAAARTAARANTVHDHHDFVRDSLGSEHSSLTSFQAPPRIPPHILHYLSHNYDAASALTGLTEHAIAAHDHHAAMCTYPSHVGEWVRSQRPHEDDMSVDISIVGGPRTVTPYAESTLSSSWTIVSMSATSVSPADSTDNDVCAAGFQFEGVLYPRNLDLDMKDT
ncbi:hypothetical protein F5Y16DRAFT_3499 [Xylariaceae sp. FL0255]|nr:hypothetical protein F5Y16DRAFT_3499 [Xylariaceae sp. FL0255]